MMHPGWLGGLYHDPVPYLLASNHPSIVFFTRKDLLEERPGSARELWKSLLPRRALGRQKPDGRWAYPGGGNPRIRSHEDYDQLETFRQLGVLVEEFSLDRTHPGIRKAAEFLFSHQTDEGDFRGIYGSQYSPNYTAAIMELLIKAGYVDDDRVEKGFHWLLSMHQEDGGWAIPLRTAPHPGPWTSVMRAKLIQPDRSKPFSHLVTGVVLRAFAAHPDYRKSSAATAAGELLIQRFFKADSYIDRKAPDFWGRVSFPFWFTDIVSSLDSLSTLGFMATDSRIRDALDWLASRQVEGGSFSLKLLRDADRYLTFWICLAVCRVFKRFYS